MNVLKLGNRHLSKNIVKQVPNQPLWNDEKNVVVFLQGLKWYGIYDNDIVGITEGIHSWHTIRNVGATLVNPKEFVENDEEKAIFWAENASCNQARLIRILGWVDLGDKDFIYALFVRDRILMKFKTPRIKPVKVHDFLKQYMNLNNLASVNVHNYQGHYSITSNDCRLIKPNHEDYDFDYGLGFEPSWFEELMFSNFLNQFYGLDRQIYVMA
ncbi:hypothetical protein [Exiguobacterium sp. s162]|uniref:hypothetical protein n=1 Tax=Exiguobacterium sp. s162 TaxID=2751276 RepID=UPI001BEBA111|nr:hypothetical protein [Exiguobacterium sp. s162]